MMTLSKRRVDLGLFLTLLAFAVAAFSVTATFPSPLLPGYPGSAMFPRLVLATMGILAAFGVLRALFTGSDRYAGKVTTVPVLPFAAILAVLVVFVALMAVAGMEVAIFAFVAAGYWYRTRRPLAALLAGIATVAVVYVLFVQELSVQLPLTVLPRYATWL